MAAASDPGAAPIDSPAAAANAAAAPALPDQAFTCTSTLRSRTKIKVEGLLTGAAPSQVRVTMLTTGGLVSQVASPALDPAFDRGIWVNTYAMAPWDLSAGAPGGNHLVLPTPVAPTFAAYLVALPRGRTHTILPLACSLAPPPPVAPPAAVPVATPAPAPAPRVAVRQFACIGMLSPPQTRQRVTGGLTASDEPVDVVFARASNSLVLATGASPTLDPTYDGGYWKTTYGFDAWAVATTDTASWTLLFPRGPYALRFEAMAITDYLGNGNYQDQLTCAIL